MAVIAVLVPQTVHAHPEGWTARWTTDNKATFTDDPVLPFTFTHDGPATQPGIERVRFSYSREEGSPDTIPACGLPAPSELVVDPGREDAETLVSAIQAVLPCNGRYQVTAVATTAVSPLHQAESSPPIVLAFQTAIPSPAPTGLEVEVTELEGDTAAGLRWVPPQPAPPDLVGYLIERSRQVEEGFEVVGEAVEPSFVDAEAAEGGVFHYRVRAMRLGPDADLVPSPATSPQRVDVPTPVSGSTTTIAPAGDGRRPSGDLSGIGSLQERAGRLRPGISTVSPSGTVTTVDTGFQETLPFGPNDAGAVATPGSTAPSDGGLAADSFQLFDGGDGSERKAVLGPVAGALALLILFLQLRWLLRQAS